MSSYWIPRSVDELEAAVANSAVVETTYLDFKEYPHRTESGRKSIAVDLASFSVHGGIIVFGVAETQTGQYELKPQPIDDWREWFSQIAINGVQPAISVSTTPLTREDGDGYLVVEVPASPRSPHMAKGKYYSRSDTTNRVLADFEVRELWLRHLVRADRADQLLRDEIDRDPTPPDLRDNAHLFVVAQPLSTDRRLLLDAVDGQLRSWVSAQQLGSQKYAPSASHASTMARRAHGVGRSTYEIGPDRKLRPNGEQPARESGLFDLEVREDGGVRLFNARASDTSRGMDALFGSLIGGDTSAVIELARRISSAAEFLGGWTFGVGIVGLRSQSAFDPDLRSSSDPYSEDSYAETYEASGAELTAAGSPVLDALIGRFCRSSLSASQTAADLDLFPQSGSPSPS